MNVILFGATGMVGQGVLRECLLDPGVGRGHGDAEVALAAGPEAHPRGEVDADAVEDRRGEADAVIAGRNSSPARNIGIPFESKSRQQKRCLDTC